MKQLNFDYLKLKLYHNKMWPNLSEKDILTLKILKFT